MASNVFAVNVYQIGSGIPIPLTKVGSHVFPFAGVMIEGVNQPNQMLSTGVYVYSKITPLATLGNNAPANAIGYYALETPAALQALSN
jgi:hypothetical protein